MGTFNYTCPICKNSDPTSIGSKNGRPYCRKCISFRGVETHIPNQKVSLRLSSQLIYAPYYLNYDLSEEQKRLSNQLLKNYKNHTNSLVHAVCGSGKTEIVLKIISYAICMGYNVGFAVPRRDVVIELYDRFKRIFVENDIALVYGGHTSKLYGQLICTTTHQLFRYPNFFDLLILDEVDAFPFNGNDVLNAIFINSIRGNYVLMSATPSIKFINDFKNQGGNVLELYSRFHRYPLIEPRFYINKELFLKIRLYRLIKRYLKNKKQVFIFTPTIEECETLFKFLNYFIKNGECVHSKKVNREEIIKNFKRKKISYLVTTAVLERGITVKDLQVIVYHANHKLYDRYSLTQIAGRVGRKKEAPEGEVTYFATALTKDMSESLNDIKDSNKNLQNLFQSYQSQ